MPDLTATLSDLHSDIHPASTGRNEWPSDADDVLEAQRAERIEPTDAELEAEYLHFHGQTAA